MENCEIIPIQLSEIELLSSAYGEQFSIDEEILAYVSSLNDLENCRSEREIIMKIIYSKTASLTLTLPVNYPIQPLRALFSCSSLRNAALTDINKSLNCLAADNVGLPCCFSAAQLAFDSWKEMSSVENETNSNLSSCAAKTFQLAQVLIYFHHIKSSVKKQEIVSTAARLQLGGLWKVDFPGVVLIEGDKEQAFEWVRHIQRLQWQLMVVRGEQIHDAIYTTRQEMDQQRLFSNKLELVESLSVFGQKCEACGCHELFMRIMKNNR